MVCNLLSRPARKIVNFYLHLIRNLFLDSYTEQYKAPNMNNVMSLTSTLNGHRKYYQENRKKSWALPCVILCFYMTDEGCITKTLHCISCNLQQYLGFAVQNKKHAWLQKTVHNLSNILFQMYAYKPEHVLSSSPINGSFLSHPQSRPNVPNRSTTNAISVLNLSPSNVLHLS